MYNFHILCSFMNLCTYTAHIKHYYQNVEEDITKCVLQQRERRIQLRKEQNITTHHVYFKFCVYAANKT